MEQNKVLDLQRERTLEVKRNGIYVQYVPKFQITHAYFYVPVQYEKNVEELFETNKYPLQICSQNGKFVAGIKMGQLYRNHYHHDRIYISNVRGLLNLIDYQWYFLAKNNATLGVLQGIYEYAHQINTNILQFINGQIIQLTPNPINVDHLQIQDLNQSQQQAISKAIQYQVTFIKGPPGCGKTKTIARISKIFLENKKKVLVGSASNVAIKSIMKQIIKDFNNFKCTITLFIFKQLQNQNLQYPQQIRIHTLRYKIIKKYKQINKGKQIDEETINSLLDRHWSNPQWIPPAAFYGIYKLAVRSIINDTQLMISTTITASRINQDRNNQFTPFIGILDQAAQTSWSDSICFLVRGIQKIVFVGDDMQLTPTVISQNYSLKKTMFTQLMQKNIKYFTLLNTQYRMHPKISQFPNIQFYKNQLKNGCNQQQRSSQIIYFKKYPLSFIKHNYHQIQQRQIMSGKKKYSNQKQIQIIFTILNMFQQQQIANVGIITPYSQQQQSMKMYYKQFIANGLKIRTCDGYQGGQKDYIIVSCVRSNWLGNIGFVKEQNRLNVTLTRAKKGLVIIGNPQTLRYNCQVWQHYIDYLQRNKLILSHQQVISIIQNQQQVQQIIQKNINENKIQQKSNPQKIYQKLQQQPKNLAIKQNYHEIYFQKLIPDEGETEYQKLFQKIKCKSIKNKLNNLLQDYRIILKKSIQKKQNKNISQQLQNKKQQILKYIKEPIQDPLEKMTYKIYLELKDYLENPKESLIQLQNKIQQKINHIYQIVEFKHGEDIQIIYTLISLMLQRDTIKNIIKK